MRDTTLVELDGRDALKSADSDRIFEDSGTVAKGEGPQLSETLLRHLRKGGALVVWRLDRLGRPRDPAGIVGGR